MIDYKTGTVKKPGERLLAVAGPRLQNIIIAAIETAARKGELLALTWADVDLAQKKIRFRAETTKDSETRIIPISGRLAAVLEMAKTDPKGDDYPTTAFVFGELGQPVASKDKARQTAAADIRKAWETAVLKAHGYTPVWKHGALAPVSCAQLKTINLHFHDLRHEGASRRLEEGWPITHVQELLEMPALRRPARISM